MTKRYATTYSNGHTVETSKASEAHNFVNYEDAQTFRLDGATVSAAEFFAATKGAMEAAFDRKSVTHKLVSVQHGASQFGRVTKWVRK
jgi:hypothetical protein